jgi:hypothetical protein
MRLRLLQADAAVDADGRRWDRGSDGIWRRGHERAVQRLANGHATRDAARKPALVAVSSGSAG